MARVNAPLLAFNRCEVSKGALGRIDVEKLRLAAECQLNLEPRVIGPMALRTGLEFVGEILDDQETLLVPFVFSSRDKALLELTPNVMRIRVNGELVMRVPVATKVLNPEFIDSDSWATTGTTAGAVVTTGAGVCILQCQPVGGLAQIQQEIVVAAADMGKEHGIRVVVRNGPVTVRAGSAMGLADLVKQTSLDTGTHSLACTPHSNINLQVSSDASYNKVLDSISIDNPSSGPAAPLTLPTPWGYDDLQNIRYDQSGDIIFIGCYGQQQYKVERRAIHGWSTVLYRSNDGPFQRSPSLVANLSVLNFNGNTTLNSDRPFFEASHVGCLFRLFTNGQINATWLGAENSFAPPVRVVGVGSANRDYSWVFSGAFVGTLTLQRSFDGPDSGFSDVSSATNVTDPAVLGSTTGQTTEGTIVPDLDNAICWERVGFKGGDYTSGSVLVQSSYNGGGGYGICRVTAFNSAQSVEVEVLQPFSSLSGTKDWVEADWSSVVGWPTAVSFVEGRLGWYGRDKAWLSGSDNFTGFAEIDKQGASVGDAGPITVAMGYGPMDTISWGLPLTRLLLGRDQSVASVRSSSFDEPLTPTSASVKDCTTQGVARLKAIKVDRQGIFVQQSGRRVYELSYSAQAMDYSARDLTRLNIEIGKRGFRDIAIARQPDTSIYFARNDGMCAVLLYDPDDDVVGWWRIMTLGSIENVCVLPSADGIEDEVYFVVRRVIEGVTRRFVERLAPRDDCIGGLVNQLLDSHVVYQGVAVGNIRAAHLPSTRVHIWADGVSLGEVTTSGIGVATLPGGVTAQNIVVGITGAEKQYSGEPTATFTGLDEYNGLTAEVFADQQPSYHMVRVGSITVSNGAIVLPENWKSAKIIAYFGYMAPFMSAKLVYAAQLGTPLTQKKKIDHIGLLLFDTHARGIATGQSFDHLDALPQIEGGGEVDADTVWGQYDQPVTEVGGAWDTDARLCLLAQAPFPCGVSGVIVSTQTNEK